MPSPDWNLFTRRHPKPAKVKPSETSFWLEADRDSFTSLAQRYFDEHRPPQTAQSMAGVTMQAMQRHGLL